MLPAYAESETSPCGFKYHDPNPDYLLTDAISGDDCDPIGFFVSSADLIALLRLSAEPELAPHLCRQFNFKPLNTDLKPLAGVRLGFEYGTEHIRCHSNSSQVGS